MNTELKNEIFEISKTMACGLKTFRSYRDNFTLNDYTIAIEPSSNRYDDGYVITISHDPSNEIFAFIPIWYEDPMRIAESVINRIDEYESLPSPIIDFVNKLDELTQDDKELLALYSEHFELSFHGMKIDIPWGAPSYNAITDALKQIHEEMEL